MTDQMIIGLLLSTGMGVVMLFVILLLAIALNEAMLRAVNSGKVYMLRHRLEPITYPLKWAAVSITVIYVAYVLGSGMLRIIGICNVC